MFPDDANPLLPLSGLVNIEGRRCHLPSVLIDTRLRPPTLDTIPDIDMKFFTLHKFIGDIVWMCGGVEPESDDEDEDGEDMRALSAENWVVLQDKLTCPADFVAQHDEINEHIYIVKEQQRWNT